MYKMICDQCRTMAINGQPTHEIGCPNTRKKWVFDDDAMEVYPSDEIDEDWEVITSLASRLAFNKSLNT